MSNNKWNNPDGTRMECAADRCIRPVLAKALCSAHYHLQWTEVTHGPRTQRSEPCPVAGCTRQKVLAAPLCKKCNQFRWRYSLSVERVLELHLPQNRACGNGGCGSTERLHMDHDHACCSVSDTTGSRKAFSCGLCVRGWLCGKCNTALGLMQEDPQRIEGLLRWIGA